MSAAAASRALPWGYSLGLHAVLAAALASGLVLPRAVESPPPALTIEAMVVDQVLIEALADRRRDEARERQRLQAADDARRQQEAEREAAAQAQQQRQAEVQRQAEAQRQQQAADARRRQEAEQARRAEDQRKAREAAEKQKAEADARRAREEAAARAAREADLRARLAAEERRTSAAAGGLRAQYIAAIQAHVENRWFKPPGMRPESRCQVAVTQIPGGEVVDVRIAECNATEVVRQSILAAVRNASPLPSPPDPALFERQVLLTFRGDD